MTRMWRSVPIHRWLHHRASPGELPGASGLKLVRVQMPCATYPLELRMSFLAGDLYQHPLRPVSVKLAVEDLFPRPEIELALRDCNHDFPSHDLPFQMGVGVVFAGAVVMVEVRIRVEGGELLQPFYEIVMKAALVVVDKDGGGNVHGVNEDDAFLDAAFSDASLDIAGDVYEIHLLRDVVGQIFG